MNVLIIVSSKGKNIGAVGEIGEDLLKAEARAAKLSKTPRPSKDFTKAGKEAVRDVNKAKTMESLFARIVVEKPYLLNNLKKA